MNAVEGGPHRNNEDGLGGTQRGDACALAYQANNGKVLSCPTLNKQSELDAWIAFVDALIASHMGKSAA